MREATWARMASRATAIPAQVPRTVTEETLYGTALTVGYEAIKFHQLYPEGEV
jgi:hypothetical protein